MKTVSKYWVVAFLLLLLLLFSISRNDYLRYSDMGFKAGIHTVDLYGKVVDQHGIPVVGAEVIYFVLGRFLAPGKGRGIKLTDTDGRFEIHSEGASIEIGGVSHPDIIFIHHDKISNEEVGREISMTFYDVTPVVGRAAPLLSDTSKEEPYLFTAWRQNEYDQVKNGVARGFIKANGTIYTIDLNIPDRHERFVEGAVDGHLRVTCERGALQKAVKQNWRVAITPIYGGIQSTSEHYMNIAPEGNYQSSVTIEMDNKSAKYKDALYNLRYFFTANNGQDYGSIFLTIEPFAKLDKCVIFIDEFKLNPNGSRNLAIKPN